MSDTPTDESLREGHERDQHYAIYGWKEQQLRMLKEGSGFQLYWLENNGMRVMASKRLIDVFKTFYCPHFYPLLANEP